MEGGGRAGSLGFPVVAGGTKGEWGKNKWWMGSDQETESEISQEGKKCGHVEMRKGLTGCALAGSRRQPWRCDHSSFFT